MKSFRFRLQRVLDWRQLRCSEEEQRLKNLTTRLSAADARVAELQVAKTTLGRDLLHSTSFYSGDLTALVGSRRRLEADERAAALLRDDCANQVLEQRRRLIGEQRECRLLEKLKAKRYIEYEYEVQRQLEAATSELYLCRWKWGPPTSHASKSDTHTRPLEHSADQERADRPDRMRGVTLQ